MKRATIFNSAKTQAINNFYKHKKHSKQKTQKIFFFVRENAIIRNVKLKKLPKPTRLKDQLAAVDQEIITEPYDMALVYLANGGKIHPSAVIELFGKHSERQRRTMISLLHSHRGLTIDELAHSIWEQRMNDRYNTEDYKDGIEQALQVHVSPASAARELIEKYDYNTQYQKHAI